MIIQIPFYIVFLNDKIYSQAILSYCIQMWFSTKKMISIIMLLFSIFITLAISEMPMIMNYVRPPMDANPDKMQHVILEHLPA